MRADVKGSERSSDASTNTGETGNDHARERSHTLEQFAKNVTATIKFTPGTVINRRASGQLSVSCAIARSTNATSPSRKVDLP